MTRLHRLVGVLLVGLLCSGGAENNPNVRLATATFTLSPYPYFPGSRVPLRLDGMTPPYRLTLLGSGTASGDELAIPSDAPAQASTLIGASARALAMASIKVAATPDPAQPFIAVASYDTGVVLHQADPPFAPIGTLGIGGAPSDVGIGANGLLAAADTTGTTFALAHIQPWSTAFYNGVSTGDDVAIDDRDGAVYVSDRDGDGTSSVTRIDARGVTHIATQATAEGLAFDSRRGLLYTANVNSGTVSIIDTATLQVRSTFAAIGRDFSLALSGDGSRLYVVSNTSLDSPFQMAGAVVAFDVSGAQPRAVARSQALAFPVGVAVDSRDRRVFVTDEETEVVYVLDAATLRPIRAPLATCEVPWLPTYDAASGRLYVPCARSNAIDVFDARSLARNPGAPFATGGYPLAVALWHPPVR